MGNTGSERISNSFHQSANLGALAEPSYVLSREKPANTRGSRYTVREGGCCLDIEPSTSGEFLFHTLPGPQKGSDEASDKPQEVKRIGHFKMEGMGSLRELLRMNDWMVKVDLRRPFTVPIHPSHHSYLMCRWDRSTISSHACHLACLVPYGFSPK